MSISIRSNIGALRAGRYLNEAISRASRSIERLSSGMRINHASDDASNLAISSKLAAQSRQFNRGKLNVNDGISALQIADGSLGQVSSIVSRMAELAEQAANGSLSTSQRAGIQKEYQALDQEIRRIQDTTTFNGIKLLKADYSNIGGLVSLATNAGNNNISADGRYITYTEFGTSNLYQYDNQTGTRTAIATGISSTTTAASSSGEIVVYYKNDNIYKYDRSTGQTTQVTNSIGGETYTALTLSADGSTVGFTSVTQYVDGGTLANGRSAAAGDRLYTLNLSTGVFRTVGDSSFSFGSIENVVISADGSKVGFTSSDDLTGNNADANDEVFLVSFSGSSASFVQATDTTINQKLAKVGIANDGTLYFQSKADLVGANSGEAYQLYSYSLSGGRTTQLTALQGSTRFGGLTLNNDATAIYFDDTNNATGNNPTGAKQVFKLDLIDRSLYQISQTTSDYSSIGASIFSADGTLVLEQNGSFLYSRTITPQSRSLDIETGTSTAGRIQATIQAIQGTLKGLGGHLVSTASSARGALDAANNNITALGSTLGLIGAGLSRLASADRILGAQVVEINAARGRIIDTDVAEESARLVRYEIQQQTDAALLAQANQQPSLVLTLLSNIGK